MKLKVERVGIEHQEQGKPDLTSVILKPGVLQLGHSVFMVSNNFCAVIFINPCVWDYIVHACQFQHKHFHKHLLNAQKNPPIDLL